MAMLDDRSVLAPLALAVALVVHVSSSCAEPESAMSGGWDVIVVGGGLMGSSTAWQLARAGQRVLVLEKQGEVYSQGSSLGEARISRSLGPPGDVWSYLHNRTVEEVEKLVDELNELNEHGDPVSMESVYTTSPVNYVRHMSRLDSYSYLPEQRDRYQLATTPEEAKELFGLDVAEDIFHRA